MKDISIGILEKKDHEVFENYISNVFYPGYILGVQKYRDWQYKYGGVVIAREKYKIIGHCGYFDLPYETSTGPKNLRILANLATLPALHHSGIGALISKKVFETEASIFVSGYNAATQSLCAHLRKNWRDAGILGRYIIIFNPGHVLFEKFEVPATKNSESSSSDVFSISDEVVVGPEFDVFWDRVKKRFGVTVVRSSEYLSWRFVNHPLLSYKMITLKKDGEIEAFCFWRIEADQNFKIARIIDLVSTDGAQGEILREFVRQAKNEKADAADFMYSGSVYNNTLLQNGFFSVTGTDFANFTILFSPISHKKFSINFGYDLIAEPRECYITKADGDQDRPNVPKNEIPSS